MANLKSPNCQANRMLLTNAIEAAVDSMTTAARDCVERWSECVQVSHHWLLHKSSTFGQTLDSAASSISLEVQLTSVTSARVLVLKRISRGSSRQHDWGRANGQHQQRGLQHALISHSRLRVLQRPAGPQPSPSLYEHAKTSLRHKPARISLRDPSYSDCSMGCTLTAAQSRLSKDLGGPTYRFTSQALSRSKV
jgi:hypothetical protein